MPIDNPSGELDRALTLIYNGDFGTRSVDELRALENGELRLMRPGEPVACVTDRRVPTAYGTINARLYKPSQHAELPLLLYLHGGAWMKGSIDLGDPFCRALANRTGCAILSVDYRLAPEHPYPAALEDCRAALDWVHAEADVLRVDRNQFGVIGESAGGNLAAALCRAVARSGGPAIQIQCLLCPALDASMSTESMRTMSADKARMLGGLWLAYRADAPHDDPYVSPLLDPEDLVLPRTIIVVAGRDALRDEGAEYGVRLMRTGADVCIRCYQRQGHCFFLYDALLPRAADAVNEIAQDICGSFAPGRGPASPDR